MLQKPGDAEGSEGVAFLPVLPRAFPSFTCVITSYKANKLAEKGWVFFQRPTSCSHWVGKPDLIFFIILLSHWHGTDGRQAGSQNNYN